MCLRLRGASNLHRRARHHRLKESEPQKRLFVPQQGPRTDRLLQIRRVKRGHSLDYLPLGRWVESNLPLRCEGSFRSACRMSSCALKMFMLRPVALRWGALCVSMQIPAHALSSTAPEKMERIWFWNWALESPRRSWRCCLAERCCHRIASKPSSASEQPSPRRAEVLYVGIPE